MKNNANSLKKRLSKQKNNSQVAVQNTFISVNATINISSTLTKEEREERLALAKKQTDHIIYREKELLEDYKKDKEIIREIMRGQLKYANRGQAFAFGVILLGFVFGVVFAYLGMSGGSIASVLAAIGTIAYQFLGKFKPKPPNTTNLPDSKQG